MVGKKIVALGVIATALGLSGCGGGGAPTQPTPTPTPAPAPSPTPSTTPAPPPEAAGCSDPKPGPVGRMEVKVQNLGRRKTLDSTPLVGPDRDYCAAIGYTDGRRFCPTRPEGHPERGACDALVIGAAKDTGRIGPTWTTVVGTDAQPCLPDTSGATPPYCQNHPENQFLVYGFGPGTFQACGNTGVCGEIFID